MAYRIVPYKRRDGWAPVHGFIVVHDIATANNIASWLDREAFNYTHLVRKTNLAVKFTSLDDFIARYKFMELHDD